MNQPRDTVVGLRADERLLTATDYFARFVWSRRRPDPHRMTAREFFSALENAPRSTRGVITAG